MKLTRTYLLERASQCQTASDAQISEAVKNRLLGFANTYKAVAEVAKRQEAPASPPRPIAHTPALKGLSRPKPLIAATPGAQPARTAREPLPHVTQQASR